MKTGKENIKSEGCSFPSRFGIGDTVEFYPMAAHLNELSIEREKSLGTVVAVKFTKAKVWYDVLDDYRGRVFNMIDSSYISPVIGYNIPETN